MKILVEQLDLDAFFLRLAAAPASVLFLDYDGTLAPFHIDRDQARPYPGVCEVLDRIMADGRTRVVVISGRWTKDLIPLLGLRHQPEIWGSHGWERLLPDGDYTIAQPDRYALQGLAEADTWIDEIMMLGGRVEEKPACLAVHWRGLQADKIEHIRRMVVEKWVLLARESGLDLHEFDGGLELRVPGRNKGDAVATVSGETEGEPPIAYLGDDYTDEDAFRALKGRGLGVLVRPELRPTSADLWLQPPEELLEFLNRWAQMSGDGK